MAFDVNPPDHPTRPRRIRPFLSPLLLGSLLVALYVLLSVQVAGLEQDSRDQRARVAAQEQSITALADLVDEANARLEAADARPVAAPETVVDVPIPQPPERGPAGMPGAPGPTGPPGATVTGPAGPPGLAVTGTAGDSGRDGEDGRDGVDGRDGAPGADGKDSTVPGPAGADSTVPGPAGAAGPACPAGATPSPAVVVTDTGPVPAVLCVVAP